MDAVGDLDRYRPTGSREIRRPRLDRVLVDGAIAAGLDEQLRNDLVLAAVAFYYLSRNKLVIDLAHGQCRRRLDHVDCGVQDPELIGILEAETVT
jgi:hypothetical protein